MKFLRRFFARLSAPFIRQRQDRDLALELHSHIEMLADENIRGGMDPAEAHRQARMALGGIDSITENCRDHLGLPLLFSLLRDLRYAARTLRRNPTFAFTAILTLALGIGANTAIFSLLNAVMFRTLPVHDPRQLVLFGNGLASGSSGFLPANRPTLFSYPFYRQFRRDNSVFSDVIAIDSTLLGTHGRISHSAGFEKVRVELVSGNYFSALGVAPVRGRVLSDADDGAPGVHPVAVASFTWWRQHLAADPIGTTVTIGSTAYTIVGVAPPGFSGLTVGQSPDLWVPLAMQAQISPDFNGLERNLFQSLNIVAILKPGIDRVQAQSDANFHFHRIMRAFAGNDYSARDLDDLARARIDLTPAATGRSIFRARFSSPLTVLMAAVDLVLLIVCANVANLLLSRAAAREREIAVRLSIGAARGRLVRQLLVESGLLGLAGCVLGIALAWGAGRVLLAMVSTGPETVPIRIEPDLRVLVFTFVITTLTVFFFGVIPAIQSTASDPASSLKGHTAVGSPARGRLARGLVVGQVALSLALLAGAGLFLRTLSNLVNVDTGFDRNNVLLMGWNFTAGSYNPDARAENTMERIEQRVNSLPGIQGAGFALFVFSGGAWSQPVSVPGRPESSSDPEVDLNIVGPRYLDTMKMPILAGRGLDEKDNAASPKVAVINETMARTYFAGVSPLGRTFDLVDDETGDRAAWTGIGIVGIVKDAKYLRLDEKPMPAAFFPHAQHTGRFLANFVARYTGDAGVSAAAIRSAVREIDPNLPPDDITTLARAVDDRVVYKRIVAQLCTFFALLAASLACVGIYGVMSWSIVRRTGEFGVRTALGAGRSRVLWIVLREILLLIFAGVAIGLAIAASASRFIASLLYGLSSVDPLVLGLAIAAMTAAALLAGYLPARRATRIDPMAALRYE